MTVYLQNQSDFAAMNEVYRTYWTKDPPARTTVMVPLLQRRTGRDLGGGGPDGGERVVVNPSDWMASPNPYSYGIKSGNTLFLAGLDQPERQGQLDDQGRHDDADQDGAGQRRGAVLKAAGMSFADVVCSRIYITDAAAFQDMNAAYRTYFPTDPPARATVKAALDVPDYIVEITMVAVKDAGRKTAITTPTADGTPGHEEPEPQLGDPASATACTSSGILGNTPANKGDVKAQTAEALARIGRTLKAAGFDWSHVVDGVVYLPDMTKFADMNASYREMLGKDFPARATVGAGLMGADGAVEIMFTAVK